MEIPKFSSAYQYINPSNAGTSSLSSLNEVKGKSPMGLSSSINFAIFHGDGTGLIMPKSEATDRMQAVLDRLDETSGTYLVSSGLFENEDFLTFAEGISDIDLENFAQTTKALRTPSDQIPPSASYSAMPAIRVFFENLQTMGGDTVSRVLEKTAELSVPVPAYERKLTYDATGQFPQGSAAATPLHNFVKAVATMSSAEINEDANNLLDNLALYGEELESTLLQVASADSEIALKIMTQMQGYDLDTQEDVFSYLAKLTSSINPSALPPPKTAKDREPGEDGWSAAIMGIYANSKEVIVDMMDTFSTVIESYLFTDEKMTGMATDLSGLDTDNQRAYLEITETGLNTLLRESGDQSQEQLAIPNDVFAVVDSLRNHDNVRLFVIESGRGDKETGSGGQNFYEIKGWNDSKQDEAQTIEVLTSQAWFNRDSIVSSGLITALRSLDAGQRDLLVDDLSGLNNRALFHVSTQEEGVQALQQRLDVIGNTGDLSAILAAQEKLPDESVESFWSAASFLEQESDQFVEMINRSNQEGAQVLVGLIVSLEESVEYEEMTYEEAFERAQDILNAFS